jgi:hypothetical protein
MMGTSPKDLGEEMPSWFLPARYKLYFKAVTENRNSNVIVRKPIPKDIKAEFAKHSKEYHAYKLAERELIDQENNDNLIDFEKSMGAAVFLPDYLLEEAFSDAGAETSADMEEF